ncbi:MAG: 2-amino-4-hydroxy-6-hydroxymethyldihydropteridine diphosphokinase [Planctomycetota bacterium]
MSTATDGGATIALVALGANLGDRLGTMRHAVAMLRARSDLAVAAVSGVYDTAPVGPPDQPRYLNAAVALRTALAPRALLEVLLSVERDLGRERGATRWTARTIDLDLILHGECRIDDGDLRVPHPRFRERAFVLLPLAEIAPSARDPETGERVESLLRACPGRSDAVRVGPLEEP